jgi:hypothetical protein
MVQNLLPACFCLRIQGIKIYKTTVLPVVLYGCETSSLILREGHRLTVFEKRVLSKIFGPKRDEVTGEWRRLHNEELHRLYSPNTVSFFYHFTIHGSFMTWKLASSETSLDSCGA